MTYNIIKRAAGISAKYWSLPAYDNNLVGCEAMGYGGLMKALSYEISVMVWDQERTSKTYKTPKYHWTHGEGRWWQHHIVCCFSSAQTGVQVKLKGIMDGSKDKTWFSTPWLDSWRWRKNPPSSMIATVRSNPSQERNGFRRSKLWNGPVRAQIKILRKAVEWLGEGCAQEGPSQFDW